MEIIKKKKYTHLKITQNTVENVLNVVKKYHSNNSNEHLIVEFSDNINIDISDLLLFLKLGKTCRKNGTSFVIIYSDIDVDDVPDEINIVPTFTEALDILEMDAIERDLGF
jgi:hypothetical protein